MMPLLKQVAMVAAGTLICFTAAAQTHSDIVRPAILPIDAEPAPKIIAYPPIPEALARGVVIIQYRTENMRVKPIFGKSAVEVSPRLGHLHVTIDDWQGTWAHTSEDPIIVVGLKPGTHTVLLELADPNHKILARETVSVVVPEKQASVTHGTKH